MLIFILYVFSLVASSIRDTKSLNKSRLWDTNILTNILYNSDTSKTLQALCNKTIDQSVLLSCCFRKAHLVSHDMGDSILTEILSRHSRAMLPEYFNEFFQSVTFTNGGMIYDLIDQRLSQVQIITTYITNNVILCQYVIYIEKSDHLVNLSSY